MPPKQIDFPILYQMQIGVAHLDLNDNSTNLQPLFDKIIEYISAPPASDNDIPQLLVTNLSYDPYVGQIAMGRLSSGTLEMNKFTVSAEQMVSNRYKVLSLLYFSGLQIQVPNLLQVIS